MFAVFFEQPFATGHLISSRAVKQAIVWWWMCPRPRQWRRRKIIPVSISSFTTLSRVVGAFTGCFLWGQGADTQQMTLSGWGVTPRPAPSPWSTTGSPANSWPSTPTDHPRTLTCCSPSRTWARGVSCRWTALHWATWRGRTSRTRPWSGSESMRCWSSVSPARPRGTSRWSLRSWPSLRPERRAWVCPVWHQSWTQAHVRWAVSQVNWEHMGPWRPMRLCGVIHDEPWWTLRDSLPIFFFCIWGQKQVQCSRYIRAQGCLVPTM